MQDILLKGLQRAAKDLELNEGKSVHIKDLLVRLAQASDDNPHDQVIRIVEDVFQKRARHDADRIVTANEFNEIKQSVWNLYPNTAINGYFPDMKITASEPRVEQSNIHRTDYENTNRPIEASITSAEIQNQARSLVINALKSAGVHHVQTHFVRGLTSSNNGDGTPREGILMFAARVVTKAGETDLSIPVLLTESRPASPDSFAVDGMYYPLSTEGISNYSLGLSGISTDRFVEESRTFGSNEIRDIPVVDSTASDLIRSAKEKVYYAFREAGVSNCQIKFSTISDEEDGSATMSMEVNLPFAKNAVSVPVVVENDSLIYSPSSFFDASGQEYDISTAGVKTYLSGITAEDKVVASRVDGDGTPRELPKGENTANFRQALSVKLSEYLAKRGAVNPQVYHVTTTDHGDSLTESFIAVFGSSRGPCHVAVPISVKKGETVEPPSRFFGLDEKEYDLTTDGLRAYVETKSPIGPIQHTSFHTEHSSATIDSDELDSNVRKVTRREGYELGERVIRPKDETLEKSIAAGREAILIRARSLGLVNPQVFLQKIASDQDSTLVTYGADFQTSKGVRKATFLVRVIGNEVLDPQTFVGSDDHSYAFSPEGVSNYLAGDSLPVNELEAELSNKLNLMSFGDLKSFMKSALLREDATLFKVGIMTLGSRFGSDAATNCLADLSKLIDDDEEDGLSTRCGGCPFFRGKKDGRSRTAHDMCMKFNVGVHKVAYGGHHKNCTIQRQTVKQSEEFEGSIVTSHLKLT